MSNLPGKYIILEVYGKYHTRYNLIIMFPNITDIKHFLYFIKQKIHVHFKNTNWHVPILCAYKTVHRIERQLKVDQNIH